MSAAARRLSRTLPLALLVFFGALLLSRSETAAERPRAEDVRLVVHAPTAARRAVVVPAELFIAAPAVGRYELLSLRLAAGDTQLYELPLSGVLEGDPDYIELEQWIERLPQGLTHRHGPRHFAAADAPVFPAAEWSERVAAIRARLADLRERARSGALLPYAAEEVWLPLDQVFAPGVFTPVFAPGALPTRVEWTYELDYRAPSGALRTARATATTTWLGPVPTAPPGLATVAAGSALHAGDLHVHSCHGEATNACSPSADCAAESFQTSGSFSYAALKAQYQALGYDWFTATDHSYCITTNSQFQAIQSEVAALVDANFLVLADIEVSSDEVGSQIGSDVGDLACIFGTEANHMGAHGISTRIPGGSNGFLGFCNGLFSDALASFTANVANVRAQGGYPIVNHPTGSFGWNSFAATQGLEANQLHGVEIWNGAFVSGQGGDVGQWVDWLLAGRMLYAYSGSDTHDAAFAFGANYAVLDGAPLTAQSLLDALAGGRSFVSNGPTLCLEVDLGPDTLFMGTIHALPAATPPTSVSVRAAYDFGTSSGRVSLYEGRVGDASEALLAQSTVVTGAGTFAFTTPLATATSSWFRAYAENVTATEAAYSNPVFFRAGLADIATYCTPKTASAGCNATLSTIGAPSASWGSPFLVQAREVLAQKPGLAFFGIASAAIPFQGGTLCVAPPLQRGPLAFSGGNPPPADCSGVLVTDVGAILHAGTSPALQAGTTSYAQVWYRDPADATGFGTGLSNGLTFTVAP